jgi:glutamyl endopeptidase
MTVERRGSTCVLGVVVLVGMGLTAVAAENPNGVVFSDGREIGAAELAAAVELAKVDSSPSRGGGLATLEALVDLGVDVETAAAPEGLKPVTAQERAEALIGDDTRARTYTADYPSRAVALVTFSAGFCSGWLIGPDTVATAGHCVYEPGVGWYTGHTIYPGYDGSSAPHGSCGVSWLATVNGWANSADETYDYGVIKLNCDVGYAVGWFGFMKKTDTMNNYPTTITGYPGDKPNYQQWQSHDKVRVTEAKQLYYFNDTYGGMSGSPVWFDENKPTTGTYGPYGIAIHAYGMHGRSPHSKHNHGTRIDASVYKNLLAWKAAAK